MKAYDDACILAQVLRTSRTSAAPLVGPRRSTWGRHKVSGGLRSRCLGRMFDQSFGRLQDSSAGSRLMAFMFRHLRAGIFLLMNRTPFTGKQSSRLSLSQDHLGVYVWILFAFLRRWAALPVTNMQHPVEGLSQCLLR